MKKLIICFIALIGNAAIAAEPSEFEQDAQLVEQAIEYQYAYQDRLPDDQFKLTAKLRSEADEVKTKRDLVRFAERALTLLADHHAITGASLSDSWAVFPSYGDLWIERHGEAYLVEQVREDSPASRAGIDVGDQIVGIGGVPTHLAVEAFWTDLGVSDAGRNEGYAARVLAAGKRDQPRILSVKRDAGEVRDLQLPNLYSIERAAKPPLSASLETDGFVMKFNDSLGNNETITAFDTAMAALPSDQNIILDLTDTPSGGNTTVARAIMGWFVEKPTAYQIHSLPAEQRETGIARQWIEQVLPRQGKYHSGSVTVRVGRWTGSMGEGLAIGLDSMGANVTGSPMAGLLGAVFDLPLPSSGLVLKLPAERLYAVDGTPREEFIPASD